MQQQRAVIVRYRFREESRDVAVAELNGLLREGWRVVHASPMGAAALSDARRTGHNDLYAVFASLVVLERDSPQRR